MFYLFFSHLGVGLIGSLGLLPLRRLGPGFFRFNVLLGLGFLLIAAASGWGRQPPWELFACIVLATAHVVSLRRRHNPVSLVMLYCDCAPEAAALVREAHLLASAPQVELSAALLAAHFLTSAALLGAVTLDMILGHWYLVIPGLSFGHLRHMTLVFAAALGLRLLVSVWTVAGSWDAWRRAWQLDPTRFLLEHGFFLTLRVLFGIVGPAVLLYLVWECVRTRSNTSATGILYVATAVVLIGEIASKHFLTAAAILL
ncbi:MAG: hypothetical protein ACE5G2_12420 [Candidatus Krumholzibacteriia bacterium]